MIIDILSTLLILAGALFTLIGAIGMLRMPEFFTRLHPAGLKDSAGIPLVLLGLMLQAGWSLVALKLFLLTLFLLLTNPTASHALAKTALMRKEHKQSPASRLHGYQDGASRSNGDTLATDEWGDGA